MREEDLPKHVRKRGKNALQYRRRFEGVKDSKAVFQRAMNSKLSDDASTVQAEAAQKTKVYELELRKRTSAHPDSFTENDIDTLAAELLKQKSKQHPSARPIVSIPVQPSRAPADPAACPVAWARLTVSNRVLPPSWGLVSCPVHRFGPTHRRYP